MKFNNYNSIGNKSIVVSNDGTTEWLEVLGHKICLNLEGPHQNFPNSYFIKTHENSNFINEVLRTIEFDFASESDFSYVEQKSISEFLKYFENGNYHVEYGDYELGEFHLPYKSKGFELVESDLSEYRLPLMCTIFKSDLNFDIIEHYKTEIKEGSKPIILAFRKDYGSDTGSSFLLDGHHKLMAYNALQTKPNIWEIVLNAGDNYDTIDQDLCKHLNFNEIKETSLRYFYKPQYDKFGTLIELK